MVAASSGAGGGLDGGWGGWVAVLCQALDLWVMGWRKWRRGVRVGIEGGGGGWGGDEVIR